MLLIFGHKIMRQAAIAAAALMLFVNARSAWAQATLENDQMRLELIGLKRWTVPMIQDSLRRYAPTDSLLSHACAAILRGKLGFADASVTFYTTTMFGKAMKPYVAVTVVEPQDSALVRYRRPFLDSLPLRREWAGVSTLLEQQVAAFQGAVQRPSFVLGDVPLTDDDSALRPALPLRRFLRAHRTAQDRSLALTTIKSDGNRRNRVAAVVLLVNFRTDDRAWWALADALRDPEAVVSSTAAQVLSAMRAGASRRVNWAPAIPTIRALLDGTNLFVHNEVMQVLASTRVDPALARPLLAAGGQIILAKLRSEGTTERSAARRFLVQIAARDFGNDPAAWSDWVRKL